MLPDRQEKGVRDYLSVIGLNPNPAENIIHILNGKQSQEYFILDAIGKIVMQGEIHSDKMILNLETLPPGSYIFKTNSSSHLIIKK